MVALLQDGRVLHLEFQVKNDPEMHWRMYHYYGTIQQRWQDADVIQVVIYLGSAPLTMIPRIDRRRCQFSYDVAVSQALVMLSVRSSLDNCSRNETRAGWLSAVTNLAFSIHSPPFSLARLNRASCNVKSMTLFASIAS